MADLAVEKRPSGQTRIGLTLRFAGLLFLSLALLGGAYVSVLSAVAAKEHDSLVINVAGRQRMLIQEYAGEVIQAVAALAVPDEQEAAKMIKQAAKTAASYAATITAFLHGGEVEMQDGALTAIPQAEDPAIIAQLIRIEGVWQSLRGVAAQVLSRDAKASSMRLRMERIRERSAVVVAEMDRAVTMLQAQSEGRLRRVQSHMTIACGLGVLLFLVTVCFVHSRIVTPLDRSMVALANGMERERFVASELAVTLKHLEVANVEANAAAQAKGDFLANMSHEIRTPMTAIAGFSNLIYEEISCCTICPTYASCEKRAVAKDAVCTINHNSSHLMSIINDILDVSKIEANMMALENIACAPCQILAEVVSIVKLRAEEKGLSLGLEYSGAIPETIQTDPTRLKQILINLMGNAVKFTATGSVRLSVRLAEGVGEVETEQSDPIIEFDVVDTGIGMTEEQIGKLFQPFAQADTSMVRKFGGTGLGLTISKRLATALGGEITVTSQPGKGSTFQLRIPTGSLDGIAMITNPGQATSVHIEDARSRELEPMKLECRVLLAEDGPDNVRLVTYILRKAGAEVVAVENGKLAAETALAAREEGTPFDVILMDMQMPVMDGYQATGFLREQGYTAPIIALTAHAMAGERRKCIDAGCDDYATKPIDRKKLVETIRAHLDARLATRD